ncbi:sugar O-acyltransferase [Listeria rocourtiae]|uniref:NeuD/PglB/VioB family sugar acetyltransferase n=1 Tax=Listeria rocourtiae TaxID=647910 RepID=UPI001627BCFC|nr:NeuD/PglB/VioB family sugar acetyltransferase [Listeria rocourtiae]MBC1605355.1 sugar O-acyltransferase [Listeria rocourtiae]
MGSFPQRDTEARKKLVIIGSGSQGRMIRNAIENFDLGFSMWGFLDDQYDLLSVEDGVYHGPIKMVDSLSQDESIYFIVAIGDPENKYDMVQELGLKEERYATIIHPFSYIDSSTRVGHGVYVSANATVMHQCYIGNHTFILAGATLEYETSVADCVLIAANASISGNVKIKNQVFVGAGAVITQSRLIGANTIIGASATVLKDIPDNSIAVGTPAETKRKSNGKSAVNKIIKKK